jgi:hypothetical protein
MLINVDVYLEQKKGRAYELNKTCVYGRVIISVIKMAKAFKLIMRFWKKK